MNKAQKDVLKASIREEKKTIRELKQVYSRAKLDCEERIRELSMRTDMENLQSIIYQQKYQEVLKNQLDDILDKLNSNQFDTISDYLNVCYENGYVGTMYDLQHQGIPLMVPINQKKVSEAIQVDTKLSSNYYKSNPLKGRLAEDVSKLKTSIRAELSRGIANGSSWNEVARKVATGMNNPIDKAYKDAMRIVRTEGHRVQQSATLDAQRVAKDKGADVVKQWDATMDSKTRPTHQRLDGQVREIEEPFEIDGKQAMFAGDFGIPSMDINCRCIILQRARWAMDEDELKTLQEKAEFLGLDKSESFEDFKQKYLKLPKNADTMKIEPQANGWKGLNYPQNYSSKKDAVKALTDKYGITFSDSRKHPIDETMICDFVSWMDSFEKQYPDFVKNNPVKVPKICVKAPSSMKNAVGYFQYYSNNRNPVELALNGYYHSSMDVFKAYEEKCIKSKWTVANATFHKTFVHEYGHYVSNTITKMKSDRSWEGNFINECLAEFKKQVPEYDKNTYVGLGDYVSRYGSTSASECFAESFAEYFGNENPRTFAKIFGEKLEEVLKGVD